MRAIIYRQTGDPDVLEFVERPEPKPTDDEVLVRIAVSGVNPTDYKTRRGSKPGDPLAFAEMVPNQDGAGTIIAVGAGVDSKRIGERVWLWEAAYQRANGTAQELVAIPGSHAVLLPESASWALGASLGVPARTAHRCLTISEYSPAKLGPQSLAGLYVLVAGGAGAVGHAAIQLAKWAGAKVITTVSSPEKASLANAAGADHVINYNSANVAQEIRSISPLGVDIIVEVSPHANSALNEAVLADNGTVAIYANDADEMTLPIRPSMVRNASYRFILLYGIPEQAKRQSLVDVQAALEGRALSVGAASGLPLHHFGLHDTALAHAAVENRTVGKVLIDINP